MFSVCNDWDTAPETEDLISGLFGTPKPFVPFPDKIHTASQLTKSSKTSKNGKVKTGPRTSTTAAELTSEVRNTASVAPSEGQKARIARRKAERKALKEERQKVKAASNFSTDSQKPSKSRRNVETVEETDDNSVEEVEEKPVERTKKRKPEQQGYLELAEKRMKGSRFRLLNERLYTSTGEEALAFFQEDPDAFTEYHDGYREQIAVWPDKPIVQIANLLKKQPKNWTVADFGCGEAQLALSIPQKTHSFDLCALNDRVTVCNMTNVPLPDSSIDVAVFCLSLMGTDTVDFLLEARRVLRVGGVLKIAEVGSRFENVKQFIHKTERLGFSAQKTAASPGTGNYFVFLEFKKTAKSAATGDLPAITLKPCVYKKR